MFHLLPAKKAVNRHLLRCMPGYLPTYRILHLTTYLPPYCFTHLTTYKPTYCVLHQTTYQPPYIPHLTTYLPTYCFTHPTTYLPTYCVLHLTTPTTILHPSSNNLLTNHHAESLNKQPAYLPSSHHSNSQPPYLTTCLHTTILHPSSIYTTTILHPLSNYLPTTILHPSSNYSGLQMGPSNLPISSSESPISLRFLFD